MLNVSGHFLRRLHRTIFQTTTNAVYVTRLLSSTNDDPIAANTTGICQSIIHPMGKVKFTNYINAIRDEYDKVEQTQTRMDKAAVKRVRQLREILDIFDDRKAIVDNYLALSEELANEKDKEMLSMGEEEIVVSCFIITLHW